MAQSPNSYDVYVLRGVGRAGETKIWGDSVASFDDERDANLFKERLESAGETVSVKRPDNLPGVEPSLNEGWFQTGLRKLRR